MAGSNSTSVTPGRKTIFTIDAPDVSIADPVFGLDRQAGEIDPPDASQLTNLQLIDGIGWMLEAGKGVGSLSEATSGQSGQYGASDLTIPSGFISSQKYRRKTELTGAYTGASSDLVLSTGMTMFEKKLAAGTDWDDAIYHLAADRTAFPPPLPGDDLVYMDRVGVATSIIHNTGRAITFSYVMPTDIVNTTGALFTFYFNAPAGWNRILRGFGIYAIKVYGDGKMQLFEQGNPLADLGSVVWSLRKEFRREGKSYDPSGINYVSILSSPDPKGKLAGPGGVLLMKYLQTANAGASRESMYETVGRAIRGSDDLSYAIPKFGKSSAQKPITYIPLRVDMRRAGRGAFGIAIQNYAATGSISDGAFSFDFFPTEDADITVEVYGDIPSSATMKPRLFRADGDGSAPVEIAVVTEQPLGTQGYQRTFTPPPLSGDDLAPLTTYNVQIDFTGDQSATPVLVSYRVIRMGVNVVSTLTPTVVPSSQAPGTLQGTVIVGSLAITGAEEDPGQEQATLRINDPLNELVSTLGLRQGMPATISTQWDPLDATKTCVLFRGDVDRAVARKRGRIGATYPSADWKQYDVTLVGPWKRLEEALVPHRFSWAIDPSAPTGADGSKPPYKVTDVLRTALSWGGFPSDRIDIPDIDDLRLFPSSAGDPLYVETFASLVGFLTSLAKDYLGGALVFDPNAGTYGKWKLVYGVRAPYTNVAYFTNEGTGVPKTLQHVLASYPAKHILADANTVEVTVPQSPIIRDTYGSEPVGMEANAITVSGSGDFTPNGYRSRLTQTVINPASFDFFGIESSDPNTPSYLNRIKFASTYVDPTLNTPEAVNWIIRRLAQYVFTPTKLVHFESPVVLIPHEDDATKRRGLRYGDPVQVNGVQLLVRNVNPKYHSDKAQIAYYELETPRVY